MIKIYRDKTNVIAQLDPHIKTEDNKTLYPFAYNIGDQANAEIVTQHFQRELEKYKSHLKNEVIQELVKDFVCAVDFHEISISNLEALRRILNKIPFTKSNWRDIYYEKVYKH